MPPPDLLDTHQLADRWHMTRNAVFALIRTGVIPPGQLLTTTRVWTRAEIEAFEGTGPGRALLARAKARANRTGEDPQ